MGRAEDFDDSEEEMVSIDGTKRGDGAGVVGGGEVVEEHLIVGSGMGAEERAHAEVEYRPQNPCGPA